MLRFKSVMAILAAFAILTLAGCGDDDDSSASGGGATKEDVVVSPEAKPYVDALVTSFSDDDDSVEFEEAQKECVGARFVDIIGVDRFKAAGVTPEDLVAADDSMEFTELDLSTDEGYKLYDSFGDCGINFRDLMLEELSSEEGMTDAAKDCLADLFTNDTMRDFMAISMVKGEDAFDEDEAASKIFGGLMACVFMGMDMDG